MGDPMKMRSKFVYLIAEAGVNHNGSLARAKQMIRVAAQAGVDAVKFQTFQAEKIVTAWTPKAEYQKKNRSFGANQLEMLRSLELSEKAHKILFDFCKKMNIEFLSTPFDLGSLQFLVRLGVRKLKIPSGELTHGPLLLAAARTRLPILLSTGMASAGDIEKALAVLRFGYQFKWPAIPCSSKIRDGFSSRRFHSVLKQKVTLLHCTTEYPAPLEDVNLRAIDTMRQRFGLRVGFSDHTQGVLAAVAAVAQGAAVIEKHFTLDRKLPGPDHAASLDPDGLRGLVRAVRETELMMGDGRKRPAPSECKNIQVARKTLVAAKYIPKGDVFTDDNLTAKRAGVGLSPMHFWSLLGRRAARTFCQDEVIIR
jgi:N-acetylneuraminate synthase